MSIKEKYFPMYMKIAFDVAEFSVAVRKKVGCVIVKEDESLTVGLNGTPPGWSTNICEETDTEGNLKTKACVIHAEANAVAKLARGTGAGQGSIAFITTVPCETCAKQLQQAGVKKVYYAEEYRNITEGVKFLRDCGIEVHKFEMPSKQ